ncbi:MAG: hypothetical protein ACXVY9_10840 [Terriglobales bacterium]
MEKGSLTACIDCDPSMLTSFRRYLVISVLATSSLLMLLLVMQQDRTISSQRNLIRQLFKDSLELNAIKVQRTHEVHK